MYWIASGLLYRRVVSPFHKLDPRVKLLISIEFFVLSLSASSIIGVGIILVSITAVAVFARSLKRVGRTVVFSLIFAAFIFGFNLLFGLGILKALTFALRFIAIIGSTSIFFVTTSPDELEQIMKWMRIPRDVVFAFVTAVRFIPVMMLDTIQIMDAQKSRGLELDKGNIFRRVRNMIPVLIPLVVNSVVRSGELAEAMESRAYGAVPKPTSLVEYHTSARDKAVAVAAVVAFALGAYSFYFILPTQLL